MLAHPYVKRRRAWHLPETTLRPGEYFLIGDNRDMPMRAHDLGRAGRDRVVGRLLC